MRDRDDPRSEHDRSRREDVLPEEVGLGRTGRVAWVAVKRHANEDGSPTDPEVPSAKRRGMVRRQRSLFVLCAVISGLLSIALFLLYRTSQKVTSSLGMPTDLGAIQGAGNHDASTAPGAASRASMPTTSGAKEEAKGRLFRDPARGRAPAATSAAPAAPSSAPAKNIFRAPAF